MAVLGALATMRETPAAATVAAEITTALLKGRKKEEKERLRIQYHAASADASPFQITVPSVWPATLRMRSKNTKKSYTAGSSQTL